MSIDQWRESLPEVETDTLLGNGSINNIIFTKLKEVFAAMLDAATLAGSWIIVDRTDGSGSATAELLLEMAVERGAQKPTILVIDSLERLGLAHDGSRSHKIISQLHELFISGESFVTQEPSGQERDFTLDFKYTSADFEKASTFAAVPVHKLPFDVIPEHQRPKHNYTCDPARKWRYFYVDGIFKAGTHIVIKNNDRDEFIVEEVAMQGFLYAHGDTRTFKRLRANIQKGNPTVMLHNSGGVVTAFSWLQRVMAYQRPPPATTELQGPLRFLVANLSAANWTGDFGVPDIIMMRSLAERAPMLFRKNVISVDILTQNEEDVLELITGCFSQVGGVPELGLGNAEVNVTFNAWMLHLTLCENSERFRRLSVLVQWLMWILSTLATTIAVTSSSFGSGAIGRALRVFGGGMPPPDPPEPDQPASPCCDQGRWTPDTFPFDCEPWALDAPHPPPAPEVTAEWTALITREMQEDITWGMQHAVIILPIMLALLITISTRMKWRDRWSVCITCADLLASEIYKFRMMTCEYDQSKPPGKDEDGKDLPPLTPKEKARTARMLFVNRVQRFQEAALTELSQSSALAPTRASEKKRVVPSKEIFLTRTQAENKPTLKQWWKLKVHLERHFHRTSWAFPEGVSFLTWMSALRPYLSQQTMKEEMRQVLQALSEEGVIKLRGKTPLSEGESTLVRQTLAQKLGLPSRMLDSVRDEIRVLQRQVVLQIAKEASKDKTVDRTLEENGPAQQIGIGPQQVGQQAVAAAAAPSRHGMMRVTKQAAVGDTDEYGDDTEVRELIMDMQGFGKPKNEEGDGITKARKKQRALLQDKVTRNLEDDYLAGPLNIDTYVCYRVRPVRDMLQKRALRRSFVLTLLDTLSFVIQSSGAILAVFNLSEWVAVTVGVSAVLQGFIEFMCLRDQVTSVNLALRDLKSTLVYWDSLSIVRRRTPAVKQQIVKATEDALLMVISAHTTASSNTITSVLKQLSAEAHEVDAANEEDGN